MIHDGDLVDQKVELSRHLEALDPSGPLVESPSTPHSYADVLTFLAFVLSLLLWKLREPGGTGKEGEAPVAEGGARGPEAPKGS